ncbi:CGNR zinc finger domain-containing protein [Gordonia hydrophobica]|uniref:CGNR zinc finger domain-containing protein n=1 Tax=Gordonia hydrophobica TaxID=40516 RepID=A0ABZ2U4C5_9ACTN|nr:CGNR zinc finger domain-containing protein [Gordonia hydrophobica]MBM7368516.1 putative RNA-binding Zn ribbon-like protein [Gordonia hydrophobica]
MIEMPLPPSPGAAEHVSIDLVNSVVHLPGGRSVDALDTPESTTAWLIDRGLVATGSELQSYCQNRLIGLRNDLQAAFVSAVTGEPLDPRVLDRVNAALVAAPHVSLLRTKAGGGFARSAEHPVTQLVEHAMSVVADDAATLLAGDDVALLAQCGAEPCTRFYLRTHGRRQWCSTRCGDRVRAARAFARKREAAAVRR